MSAHTHGPWKVENSRARSLMVVTKDFVLAQVLFAGIEPDDTDKANAYLIAAAPDMLAILKALVHPDNRAIVYFIPSDAAAQELRDDVLAAIAKAEGIEQEQAP